MYFPKREALELKSVRALPKLSSTNSAAGIWVINLEPFLPGLLTLSSSKVLIANRLFSDLPLPVSPLEIGDEKRSVGKKENKPQENALVLGGTPHMIVGVVGELENVGRERNFFLGGIAILCGIFEKNGVCVAGDVFVGVQCDQGRRV